MTTLALLIVVLLLPLLIILWATESIPERANRLRSNGWSQQTSLVNEPGSIKLIYLQRDLDVTYTVKSFTDLSTPFDDGVEVTPTASNPQPDGLPEGYTQYEATLSTTSGKGFLRVKAVR